MTNVEKIWKDMTPEEKGALLLAHHEGKKIEFRTLSNETKNWEGVASTPRWNNYTAYRVKPEPVVEIITIFGAIHEGCGSDNVLFNLKGTANDTHKITFNVVDGEIDCSSVKMGKF